MRCRSLFPHRPHARITHRPPTTQGVCPRHRVRVHGARTALERGVHLRPVRPTVAPGAPHEEAGAVHTQWPRGHFPYNEFTISRCAAGAHLACARGTMPRAPLGRTGLVLLLWLPRRWKSTEVRGGAGHKEGERGERGRGVQRYVVRGTRMRGCARPVSGCVSTQ